MVLIWHATQLKESNPDYLNDEVLESLLKMEKQLNEVLE